MNKQRESIYSLRREIPRKADHPERPALAARLPDGVGRRLLDSTVETFYGEQVDPELGLRRSSAS